jgi:drug/metabolite transporter (DMT)-like permease
MFLSSLFDFIEFITSLYFLPMYVNEFVHREGDDEEIVSKTLESRLSGFLTITAALFFYYVLKFPIFRHQMFSLVIIFICLIVIVSTEFFFVDLKTKEKQYAIVLLLIFGIHFFNALLDSIEKYLFEYDFVNPFHALMFEGFFGMILTIIFFFVKNPFQEKNDYDGKEILFYVCLFLYCLLSGGRNAYRVATNKIYSPMAKTLTDYILNPILLIHYYVVSDDFNNNSFYFILNLIISILISFCGCVYNEFLILFCCKLEYDTHYEVKKRAASKENVFEIGEDPSFISEEYNDTKSEP